MGMCCDYLLQRYKKGSNGMLLPFLFAMKLSFIERGREGLAEIGKEQKQPAKDGKEQGTGKLPFPNGGDEECLLHFFL